METVTILSRKGGTGKTTTAHALGAGLKRQGKRVLFVDADGQGNLTLTFGADENRAGVYDILKKDAKASETIQQTNEGDIIPGNELLHLADSQLKGKDTVLILSEALKEVRRKYDYCIIDTPAALGMVTLNCIVAASRIIVPVQGDLYSAQGIARINDTLQSLKEECGQARTIDGYLLTRYNPRGRLAKSIKNDLEKMAADNNTRLYKATIRECTAIKEAALMQKNIFAYSPRSNAAKDYEDFIHECLGS